MKFYFLLLVASYCIQISSATYPGYIAPDVNGHVVFPAGTTKILYRAFWYESNLKTITWPQGLVEIEDEAFFESSLYQWKTLPPFPSSLKIIGKMAFHSTFITNVTLNEGLEEIGEKAFSMTALSSVSIPSTIKKLTNSFSSQVSDALMTLTLKEGLEEIAPDAFKNDQLYSQYNPACKIPSVVFPSSLKKIGDRAFKNCEDLTSATFKTGLQEIGEEAFYQTSLNSVTIPTSIESIKSKAFSNIDFLTDVTFLGATNLTLFDSTAFEDSPLKRVTIPSTIFSLAGKGKFSTFFISHWDISKFKCNVGYGCELSQSGTLITSSKCNPGSYKDVIDKNACTGCPVGKYMQPFISGSTSSSDCTTCPVGTYTDLNGSFVCLPTSSSFSSSSSSSSSTSQSETNNDDQETKKIDIAAVVIGSFSLIINVLNFAYNFYNNLQKKHFDNKIPATDDEKEEIEVL